MSRISPKQYAEALLEAVDDRKTSHEKAMENFVALLHKNGDWSKRKEILTSYESLVRKKNGQELVVIESARPLVNDQRAAIEKMFHGKKIEMEERVNSEAIAGIKLIIDSERVWDGTLKHKLDEILSI